MNVWNFTGNVGRDSELRYTAKELPVLRFSVAVNSGYGDRKTTTWVRCVVIGQRAVALEKWIKKGTLVGVSGEASLREYTDKAETQRHVLEVRVNDVTLLRGGRNDDEQDSGSPVYEESAMDDVPF